MELSNRTLELFQLVEARAQAKVKFEKRLKWKRRLELTVGIGTLVLTPVALYVIYVMVWVMLG